jgi:hypothetical protein
MSQGSAADQPRVLKGVPSAGRFANRDRPEAGTVLTAQAAPGPAPSNGMPRLGSAAAGYTDRFDDDGNLILQVRLENGRPNDAPDGTAAVIRYSVAPHGATTEKFYNNGVLSDGSGDKPTERMTWPSGRSDVTRGYVEPHRGHITPQDSPDGQPASVRIDGKGHVMTTYYTAGYMQDPAPGVPAKVQELPDGSRRVTHAPYGRMSDLEDGTPAERRYYPDGTLAMEWRQLDGFPWDGDDGQPAERHFHPDGSVAKELFLFKGKLLNPAADTPALVEYAPDGTVTRSESRPWIDTWDGYIAHTNRPSRPAEMPWVRTEPVERYVPAARKRNDRKAQL